MERFLSDNFNITRVWDNADVILLKEMSKLNRILAMTCEMTHACDGPQFCAYKQAYGLEMTFDDEWPFETIFMAPPYLLESVSESVDLDDANATLGASAVPGDRNFARIAGLNGRWVMAWPTDPVVELLESGLGCILYLQSTNQLRKFDFPETANGLNFIIAIQTTSITTSESATTLLETGREIIGDLNVRIVLCVCTENGDAPAMATNPISDGTLFLNVFPGEIAEFVNEHLLE